jgi:hemoglobin
MAFFEQLVDDFYGQVEASPVLRAMYPEDLTEAKTHLALFLAQYFGGPTTYAAVRGHPRLRMRHVPYVIDGVARDAWLSAMLFAVERSGAAQSERTELVAYFDASAHSLQNS